VKGIEGKGDVTYELTCQVFSRDDTTGMGMGLASLRDELCLSISIWLVDYLATLLRDYLSSTNYVRGLMQMDAPNSNSRSDSFGLDLGIWLHYINSSLSSSPRPGWDSESAMVWSGLVCPSPAIETY
jgi:hypothetical protein